MTQPNFEDVVAAFMKLRADKDRIELKAKAEVALLKESMNKIEVWLLSEMEKQGLTSVKTKAGTAFKTMSDFASVADFDALLEFVRDNDAWHLLERRVKKEAVKSYIENGEPVPPGVNYGQRVDIGFRKPTAAE